MDNKQTNAERYEAIKAKYMQAANSRVTRISIARAGVENYKTIIKMLERERWGYAGVISADAAKERRSLNERIAEAKRLLAEKERELRNIDGTAEAADEIANKII